MKEPEDIVVVNGPTVDLYRPENVSSNDYSPGIVYSVQLPNGVVVTSPDRFLTDSK